MKIKLNIPTVYQCEGVRLTPGYNDVKEGPAMERFMANPLVQADIEAGTVEIVEGGESESDEGEEGSGRKSRRRAKKEEAEE